ncbi:MAG: methylmalonyl Co-A mutase-associated GTPase MeaB [Alphaproteobacteria bacterium]|nr:methylmalonyl Co-A mutase-associated GTPase MeaB [Alphaproteobacteria bacterium]
MTGDDPRRLADAVRAGDRRALARAITLVESSRRDHRDAAAALVDLLLPQTGRAIRIGISGAPGVGKSTFIEAFGLFLIARGRRPAVLAIDPSSPLTGGSILGDKTRMEGLARDPRAFIRPTPSGGTLGGVARRTREAGLICEAAGHDVVIVETVGVGQSETAVADMVDMFVLLLPPAGGDELQGIKKGIVELADLLVINKADGDLAPAAGRAAAEYKAAIQLLRPAHDSWTPPVLQVSALERRGLDVVWEAIERFRAAQGEARLAQRRAGQAVAWLWREIDAGLHAELAADPRAAAALASLQAQVSQGLASPPRAAREVLAAFLGRSPAES